MAKSQAAHTLTSVDDDYESGSLDRPRYRLAPSDIGRPIWPSDNEWGIPTLLLDMQATEPAAPFVRWGATTRKDRMSGTFHFYTEDYRFTRLREQPNDLINSRCAAAVECNFSVHEQTPRALAIGATYTKRWLARTWQAYGVRIIVDLNVAREHAVLNWLGVPSGWRSYCTRGSNSRVGDIALELAMARNRAGTDDVLFLVYGGGKLVESECQRLGVTYIPEAQKTERARGAR